MSKSVLIDFLKMSILEIYMQFEGGLPNCIAQDSDLIFISVLNMHYEVLSVFPENTSHQMNNWVVGVIATEGYKSHMGESLFVLVATYDTGERLSCQGEWPQKAQNSQGGEDC